MCLPFIGLALVPFVARALVQSALETFFGDIIGAGLKAIIEQGVVHPVRFEETA